MSTSAIVAQSDLMKQLPSCSFSTSPIPIPSTVGRLDVYSWAKIFENVASSVPLRKALEFKTVHSEACRAVNRVFRRERCLKIELYEPNSHNYDYAGQSRDSSVYVVQGSSTRNAGTAVEMVRFVLANTQMLKNLEVYFEHEDLSILNQMLEEVVRCDRVKLETFQVKRRHAGQTVAKIGEVIRKNAATLREVSRVGISEASIGLCEQTNLERLALMTFDLGFQPAPNKIPLHMLRITESGAKFSHLSYTSFSGFDPTDEIVQNMLDKCSVQSMKLTMMDGPKIMPRPAYMIGKVRTIKKIELVEIVREPQRFNKLVQFRNVFEKVFPYAQDNIAVLQQWN